MNLEIYEKLLVKCKDCGSTDIGIYESYDSENNVKIYDIFCDQYYGQGVEHNRTLHHYNLEDAIRTWNLINN